MWLRGPGWVWRGLDARPVSQSAGRPGLIGVSSGAALAAGVTIVLGGMYLPWLPRHLGSWALVAMAFGGGLAVTAVVYVLGQVQGLPASA